MTININYLIYIKIYFNWWILYQEIIIYSNLFSRFGFFLIYLDLSSNTFKAYLEVQFSTTFDFFISFHLLSLVLVLSIIPIWSTISTHHLLISLFAFSSNKIPILRLKAKYYFQVVFEAICYHLIILLAQIIYKL